MCTYSDLIIPIPKSTSTYRYGVLTSTGEIGGWERVRESVRETERGERGRESMRACVREESVCDRARSCGCALVHYVNRLAHASLLGETFWKYP